VAAAVLTGCLASPLVPTTAPAAGAGPVGAGGSHRVAPAGAPLTVSVAPAGRMSPAYDIQVRNGGPQPVVTTIRQEVPAGMSAIAISDGGSTAARDGTGRLELRWRVRVPAGGVETVSATMSGAPPNADVAAPACAFTGDDTVPVDCATATWSPPRMVAVARLPWWRQPVVAAVVAVLLLLTAVLAMAVRTSRRRRAAARQASRDALAHAEPNVYPRPVRPAPTTYAPRRRPPLWALVGLLLLVVVSGSVAALWTATRRVSAVQANRQPSSGAWIGPAPSGPVGMPLREASFEFTVYGVSCPRNSGRCQATVGLRNVSDRPQQWYGSLQRAYLADGNWVDADPVATRAAAGGRDPFADPVAPGERRLFPLVFDTAGRSAPTALELRSAVFSAGVRVNLT
jgi:hypothetical protein